ncbi:MAG: FlgD immunoglobulin-like domain containing protein, partial [Candidatus Glassbacteria bacterium]
LGVEGGDVGNSVLPLALSLMQNYPNPFNPATTISFDVPGASGQKQKMRLLVYDLRGRLVKTLIDSALMPGRHSVAWNGRNEGGERVSSGVYLYMLRCGGKAYTKKMVMLK